MFHFHSIPHLAHLRQPPYRTMASPAAATSAGPSASPSLPALPFRFLDLPLELREQIYSLYFRPADRLQKSTALENEGFHGGVYRFDMRVLRVSRQVWREARKVWRREVRTVKVGTPWPSAGTLECGFESDVTTPLYLCFECQPRTLLIADSQ